MPRARLCSAAKEVANIRRHRNRTIGRYSTVNNSEVGFSDNLPTKGTVVVVHGDDEGLTERRQERVDDGREITLARDALAGIGEPGSHGWVRAC